MRKSKGGNKTMVKQGRWKGILLVGLVGILLISIVGVFALVDLGNGEYLINGTELMAATDPQIAQFMSASINISSWNINVGGVKIFYDVVHIEPTGNDDEYGVFKYEFETSFSLDDFLLCRTNYTLSECVPILITGTSNTVFVLNETTNETYTITPTYKRAQNEALIQYVNAITLRDNLIELNDLMNLI